MENELNYLSEKIEELDEDILYLESEHKIEKHKHNPLLIEAFKEVMAEKMGEKQLLENILNALNNDQSELDGHLRGLHY